MSGSGGGLEAKLISAPAFVPGGGLRGASGGAGVGAQPFVPGGGAGSAAVSARAPPFVPGGSGGGVAVQCSASTSSLGSVNAPAFVPGGGASGRSPPVDAQPFVPRGGAASASSSPSKPPPQPGPVPLGRPPLHLGGGGGGSRAPTPSQLAAAAQGEGGRVSTPDLGLPEGDDLLGLTAVDKEKDVASQAAEMFKALSVQPPSSAAAASAAAAAAAAGGSRGRGSRGTRPPPHAGRAPPAAGHPGASAGAPGGGRGGGRGRGRGHRGGPSAARPAAAYVTAPGRMVRAGAFMADALRHELQQRSYLLAAQWNAEADGDIGLPEMVQRYHSLYPLEDLALAAERGSQALGVRSQVVKAVSAVDGQGYALRRIDSRQVIPTAELLAAAEECVARWEAVSNHPNIAGLRKAFVSSEWEGSPALYFSHDYHPGALTLEQAHILPSQTPQGLQRSPASEEQLWSYLVQLCSALRAVHSAGLACYAATLAPSKVLLTTNGRIRLGSVGVAGVLAEGEGGRGSAFELPQAQRDDLAAVGHLVLLTACLGRGTPPSLDFLTAHFSRELCHLVAGLLSAPEGSGFASWRALAAALGDRAYDEVDASALYGDALLGELAKEAENGRLLRLLAKLCFVADRPQLGGDAQWAETGDRYLVKLFRDFLFHQEDEEGAPALDWGLLAEGLNKADVGLPGERVLLMSRDEMSMLVVSYADIKRCIQSSHAELKSRAAAAALHKSQSRGELRASHSQGQLGQQQF